MTVRSSRFGAALALILALGAQGALAQQPASSGRPWVDPPVRAAASPAPARVEAQTAPATPKAAAIRRPKARLARAAPHRAVLHARRAPPAPRIAAARRVVTRTAMIAPRAEPAPTSSQTRRRIVLREAAPGASPAAMRRYYGYGYTAEAYPPRPMAHLSYGDDRAERIRQARNAGFLVMRSSVVARPDGRLLQVYQPYQGPDEDDD